MRWIIIEIMFARFDEQQIEREKERDGFLIDRWVRLIQDALICSTSLWIAHEAEWEPISELTRAHLRRFDPAAHVWGFLAVHSDDVWCAGANPSYRRTRQLSRVQKFRSAPASICDWGAKVEICLGRQKEVLELPHSCALQRGRCVDVSCHSIQSLGYVTAGSILTEGSRFFRVGPLAVNSYSAYDVA